LKDKVYYTPQEVAKALGIETYVLRYWETQFPFLNPERTKVGWRRYRKEDISKVILIKKLLYDEHFTIKGAKQRLNELKQDGQLDLDTAFEETRKKSALDEVRSELEALLALLKGVT
jgi:DNA-binding transcriptional MerR regulator